MFREFAESLSQAAKDRVGNPLIGAFAISWLIINWRIVMHITFSSDPVVDRISSIESLMSWGCTLLWPTLSACVYVSVMPWIAHAVQNVQSDAQVKRRTKKYLDGTKYLSAKTDYAEQEAKLENAKERVAKEMDLEFRRHEQLLSADAEAKNLFNEFARMNESLTRLEREFNVAKPFIEIQLKQLEKELSSCEYKLRQNPSSMDAVANYVIAALKTLTPKAKVIDFLRQNSAFDERTVLETVDGEFQRIQKSKSR